MAHVLLEFGAHDSEEGGRSSNSGEDHVARLDGFDWGKRTVRHENGRPRREISTPLMRSFCFALTLAFAFALALTFALTFAFTLTFALTFAPARAFGAA